MKQNPLTSCPTPSYPAGVLGEPAGPLGARSLCSTPPSPPPVQARAKQPVAAAAILRRPGGVGGRLEQPPHFVGLPQLPVPQLGYLGGAGGKR